MAIIDKVNENIKTAMRSKDALTLSTLRMLKSSVKNKEIDIKSVLDDDAVMLVIKTMIKQRTDSALQFLKAGRQELADKETLEIKILKGYLPEQLTNDEIEAIVKTLISKLAATSMKDMGSVMKAAKEKCGARADGKVLSDTVKRLLC